MDNEDLALSACVSRVRWNGLNNCSSIPLPTMMGPFLTSRVPVSTSALIILPSLVDRWHDDGGAWREVEEVNFTHVASLCFPKEKQDILINLKLVEVRKRVEK